MCARCRRDHHTVVALLRFVSMYEGVSGVDEDHQRQARGVSAPPATRCQMSDAWGLKDLALLYDGHTAYATQLDLADRWLVRWATAWRYGQNTDMEGRAIQAVGRAEQEARHGPPSSGLRLHGSCRAVMPPLSSCRSASCLSLTRAGRGSSRRARRARAFATRIAAASQ